MYEIGHGRVIPDRALWRANYEPDDDPLDERATDISVLRAPRAKSVRYAPIATEFPHRREMTRWGQQRN
jgi:hypothetical protein